MTKIFYNNGGCDRGLTCEVIRQIREAKTWIKACNLYYDDDDVREVLIDALRRGVAVFILTNLNGATGEIYTRATTGKKGHEAQSVQNLMHSASVGSLYDAGAHISGLDGLHAKFLLTDSGNAIVTSLNFTFKSVRNITELGVVIDGEACDELEMIFDQLFLRPDQYRFSTRGSHFIYERPSDDIDSYTLSGLKHIKMTLAASARGGGNALSKCDFHDLRDEIFDIINSANRGDDLYVATYSLQENAADADGNTIGDALRDAKARGVRLHVLMRREKYKPIHGLFINCHEDNHAKAVLTSERGIIFTGNLTTESFEHGFDIGVTLTKEQIAATRLFIKQLIAQTAK